MVRDQLRIVRIKFGKRLASPLFDHDHGAAHKTRNVISAIDTCKIIVDLFNNSSQMRQSTKQIKDVPFYEKAVAMLFATGVSMSIADGAVVYQTGLNTDSFVFTHAGGGLVASGAGAEFNFQGSSEASGFVNGIGGLSLPSGALTGFFRGSVGSTPSIGSGADPFGGTSQTVFLNSILENNAEFSADNYFAFVFTSNDINDGNAVYGWARFTLTDFGLGFAFTEWAYQDDGSAITMGAIPEPSGLGLLALGAAGAAVFHRRRRQNAGA